MAKGIFIGGSAIGGKAAFRVLLGAGAAIALASCSGGAGEEEEAAAEQPTADMTELERGALRGEGVLTQTQRPVLVDSWERELAPFDGVEFKYTMQEGEALVFSWEGTGEQLHYDMHSHPFEGGTEMTESFGVGDAPRMDGVYIAPFTGIHGWYWQNRTSQPVTVRLQAAGGFTHSTIFDSAGQVERPVEGGEAPSPEQGGAHEMREEG